MKSNTYQVAIAIILSILLLVVGDLLPFWMPDMAQMAVLLVITLLVIVWAGFIMKESPQDEREALHTMYAGRVSYLAGLATLTIALVTQGLAHSIDPWIVIVLIVMVVSKVVARLYLEHYR